jgi:Protein of unknown function (DUF3223)
MAAKPLTIGDHYFDKKGDAIAFFQEILYRYDLGDRVSPNDDAILRVLLTRHPEADIKIGIGVASFSVRSGDFSTRCFWVNRTDGTSDKFSFRTCL